MRALTGLVLGSQGGRRVVRIDGRDLAESP